MNTEKAVELIHDYQNGKLKPEDEVRLNEWYLIHATESKSELNSEQVDKILNRVRQNLPLKEPVNRIKLWSWMGAVAAALVLVGFGTFFLINRDLKNLDRFANHDISPGKVGATLTLGNGKKINLSDVSNGKIAQEAGISVTKTKDGELLYEVKETTGNKNALNTLSTARGETYILTLPDKSKVWLNAASSITYSAALVENGVRLVKLTGEAYFEISKHKAHAFVVKTDNQEVKVLGTHFNVNAYSDEKSTNTTLLEGSVKITSVLNEQILKPGESALIANDKIKVEKANVDEVIDWKEGDFSLDHADFKTAMRKIARWYDVEVIYDSSVPNDLETGGWIARTQKLSSVLKLIESSGLVHFKVVGRKVYVSKSTNK